MRSTRLAFWISTFLVSHGVLAAEVTVTVISSGKPLADAVLVLTPEQHAVGKPTPGTNMMDQRNKQFAPHVLSITTNTDVTFPNSDDIRHQVYSFSPAKQFELPLYHGTDAPPIRFDKPGVVVLGCNIHDNMIGYILVTDTPWHQVTDDQGMATLDVPSGRYIASIWHPLALTQPDDQVLVVGDQPSELYVDAGTLKPDPRKDTSAPLDNPFRRRAFDGP